MSVVVRPLDPADVAAAHDIYQRCWPEHPRDLDEWVQRFVDPGDATWVAVHRGAVVGYAQAGPDRFLSERGGWRGFLAVRPSARGHGAGAALLGRALAEARARGAAELVAEARAGQAAAGRFLEIHGFTEVHREPVLRLELPAFVPTRPPMVPELRVCAVDALGPGWGGRVFRAMAAFVRALPPSGPPEVPGYALWRARILEAPTLRPDLSQVAVREGQIVGISALAGRGDVLRTGLTAVHPDLRGQGVATTLIVAALEAARHGQARSVLTVQGEGSPMARLASRLGFEPADTLVQYFLDLRAGG